MPLFFMATGMPFFGKSLPAFRTFTAKKAKSVLVPYFVFFLIAVFIGEMYLLLFNRHLTEPRLFWLKAFLLNDFGMRLMDKSGICVSPLWFLHTLFFSLIIFRLARKLKRVAVYVFLAILLALVGLLHRVYFDTACSPFNVKAIPTSVFYIFAGYLYYKYTRNFTDKRRTLIAAFSILIPIAYQYFFGKIGSYRFMITPLYIPLSILSVIGWYELFALIKRNAALEYLGRTSLFIFALHWPLFPFIAKTATHFGANIHTAAYSISATIINIILCCLCFEAYERIKFKLVGR